MADKDKAEKKSKRTESEISAEIAELELKLEELKREREAARLSGGGEYPKHVTIKLPEGERGGLRDADGDGYYVVEVKSAEEEKAVLSGKSEGKAVPSEAVTGVASHDDADEKSGKAKAKNGKGKK